MPHHPPASAGEATAARWGIRVIVVDAVVIWAAGREVGHIGIAAVLPGFEVVDLALIRGIVAPRPRADGVFSGGHEPLLLVGHALGAVEVHRALEGMHEGDKAALGKGARDQFGAGQPRPVGELDGDFFAVTIDDAVELVERDDRIGRYRGMRGGGAGEKPRDGV